MSGIPLTEILKKEDYRNYVGDEKKDNLEMVESKESRKLIISHSDKTTTIFVGRSRSCTDDLNIWMKIYEGKRKFSF